MIKKRIRKYIKFIAIFFIRLYQWVISPLTIPSCRHIPTCSQYGVEAIERFGILNGGKLTAKRLLRCRPGGTFGYDPVPDKEEAI